MIVLMRGWFDYQRGEGNMMTKAEIGVMCFKDGGREPEPRNVSSL